MAGAGRKWAIGCGIGCGLMLLILGGGGTCTYFMVKDIQQEAELVDDSSTELRDTYGAPDDFVPDPSGVVPAGRMDVFLAVRAELTPARDRMSGMLAELDGGGNWFAKARTGFDLIPAVMGFIGERNRVLLDQGMGLGEYQYLYALGYYSLLQKDPGDGPSFVLAGDDEGDEDHAVRFNWTGGDDEDARVARARRVRRFVNEQQTVLMANQYEAWRAQGEPGGAAWGEVLATELNLMRVEDLRLPWEEGLPDDLRASLEPYRGRLDATYDPMASVVELGLGGSDDHDDHGD